MAGDNLDVARGQAEQQGLLAELARQTEREGRAKAALTETERADLLARRANADSETAGNRLWQIEEAKIASRAEILQNLAERTIRRYAAGQGAALEPGEGARMAVDILTAKDPQAAMREALAALNRRAGVPYAVAETPLPMPKAMERIGEISQSADRAVADAATAIDPKIARTNTEIAETMRTAPKAEGHIEAQLGEVGKLQADLDAIIAAERDAGRLTPTQEAIMREFDEHAKLAEGNAKAMEAAGFCAAMRG